MPKAKKTVSKKKSVVLSQDEKLDKVISGLDKLTNAIGTLVDFTAQGIQERKEDREIITGSAKAPSIENPISAKDAEETYEAPEGIYVPAKFRKIADDILSPEFPIEIHNFDDTTDFQIDIIVPNKYSPADENEKIKGVDRRSKRISRAQGENGVREWCNKVRENLNKYYSRNAIKSPFSN